MSIIRNDNFDVRAPKPIDERTTVATLADATTSIPIEYRYKGLTVFVEDEQLEYWFRDDIDDSDLILKSSGGGGGASSVKDDVYENEGVETLPSRPNILFGQAFNVEDDNTEAATRIADTIFASFVDDAVTTTQTIGGISAGTPASDLKGRTITDLFNALFFPVVPPTYTLSTLSISGIGSTNVERGLQISRSIVANFAQNDYGQGSNYILEFQASQQDADAGPFVGNTQIGEEPSYSLSVVLSSTTNSTAQLVGTVDYADAPAKNDNFGNPDPSPPSGGTLVKSFTYTSRAPIWWSSYQVAEVPEVGGAPVITESQIKTDFQSKQLDTGGEKTFILTPDAGDNWMIAACPPGNGVTFAKDEDNNIPFDSMIDDSIVLSITNGQDQAGTGINYNIHYFYSPGGFGGSQNVTIKVN